MRFRVSLHTLGCKLNQFETAYVAQWFEENGYTVVPFPSEAEVYVINTCTVTAKSEHHSRNAVRKAVRANPEGKVIVTGCAAQVNPQAFAAIPGVCAVIGNREKADCSIFTGLSREERARVMVTCWGPEREPLAPMAIQRFAEYTRAFIKVQEGCDAHCAYCIVPRARGPARSAPMEHIAAQVEGLWRAGYREIVLTGIHLGRYGRDLRPQRYLHELLTLLLDNCGMNRLRLSSIEPNEFTPELLRLIGASSRVCPHFHIPLQSGSAGVLQRMGRGYSPGEYGEVVREILLGCPDAGIGADVMVGFPGESEEDFADTCRVVESLPLAYLHVFSYSPRPGTPAALMPCQVDGVVKKERSAHLRRIGREKRAAFRSRFLGRDLEALVLGQAGPRRGYRTALTGNYIPVFVEAGEEMVNRLVMVRPQRITPAGVWGTVAGV
ncbi:MAG: tRNA (N(6)-L-threonylcarbamoyladenosine(37)-C(2))-methylthiotransferase MtaB [bacterium]